ncbi:MAG: DoxX family protein [Verrucomicrobia bacterium]|nr:DoxX family protein [Verrucomicrobiota bacterium]
MTLETRRKWKAIAAAWAPVAVRWVLGILFIYMGLNKALHPAAFLKLVRQYDMVQWYILLNLIASLLPWFEVFCGLLLIAGVAVRGSALMLVLMLIPFTFIVIKRAQAASGVPFCTIKFDCGCGGGEVLICWKVIENSLLTLLSVALLFCRKSRLAIRHSLFEPPPERTSGG